MHEELEVLVSAYVDARVLIYCHGIVWFEVAHAHSHRLFVEQCAGALSRVNHAIHTRRQHVVDRTRACVLLDIDGRSGNLARTSNCCTTVGERACGIGAPVTAHEFERCHPEYLFALPSSHEHSHEAYRLEVLYRTHLFLVFLERDLELIPLHRFLLAVAQRHHCLAYAGNEVLSHLQVFGTQ